MKSTLAIFLEPVKPDEGDIHDVEPIGSILRRIRAGCEAQMTTDFDPILSLVIDKLVEQEEAK